MPESKRLTGLDALRGIAALAVAVTHFSFTYYEIYGHRQGPAINLGAPAVALFFIISGFVILLTIDRSKTVWEFAIARFSRLYPVFWASIFLTFIIVHLADLPGRKVSVGAALINATMFPSVFGAPAVDVVYWSLTVEIYFYLIVGTILALGWRRWLVPIFCTLMIIGVADAFWPISQYRGGYRIEQMLILPWWPLFLFGITLYEMRSGIKVKHALVICLCVACCLLSRGAAGLIECGLALVVFGATRYEIPALSNNTVLYLGAISYSFYLTHCNIGYCVIRALLNTGVSQLVASAVALLTTLVLASAMCFFVERPANRYCRGRLTSLRLKLKSVVEAKTIEEGSVPV